jgi:hypothetical protein
MPPAQAAPEVKSLLLLLLLLLLRLPTTKLSTGDLSVKPLTQP